MKNYFLQITNGLNELEDYLIHETCSTGDCYSTNIVLDEIGTLIYYEKLMNQTIIGFEHTQLSFFRRKLKFLLYHFYNNSFAPIANITLPDFVDLTTVDAKLVKFTNFYMNKDAEDEEIKKGGMVLSEIISIVVPSLCVLLALIFLIYLRVK